MVVLTANQQAVNTRLETMRNVVTAESLVWAVRNAGATSHALNLLDTAIWKISCMMRVEDDEARQRALSQAIRELCDLSMHTRTVKSAFRAEHGASAERRAAVKLALVRMRSDIYDLQFLLSPQVVQLVLQPGEPLPDWLQGADRARIELERGHV